ncbi:MAG TPA: hypothetical protein EYP78_00105 [Candidatus Omnitrophica bacterium]|nr:hypothetical protein [Candidatus Omnitrophota bacterium]
MPKRNIIPGFNDGEGELKAIASWIKDKLGDETPWHLTRFFPCLYLSEINSTPIETLLKARRIALDTGLKYVYLGNVMDLEGENTYCPECNSIIVKRDGFTTVENIIKDNKCPVCRRVIAGYFISEGHLN